MKPFAGRAAIVTGATRGIGRAIALELSRRGADVAFNYAQSADAAGTLKSEIEASGVRAFATQCDVAGTDAAAGMVKQLLAYGRKQTMQPQPLVLNQVIQAFVKIVKPLIGENIEVELSLADGLGVCFVDAHQIALNVASITFMVPLGVGMAATVRVGLAAGARDGEAVRRAGYSAMLMAVGFMSLTGLLIWVFPVLMLTYSAGRSWANRRYGVDGFCIEETRIREWHFLLVGGVMLLVAWLGNGHMKDYQVGMLTGMGASFFAVAVGFGVLRWHRARRRASQDHD